MLQHRENRRKGQPTQDQQVMGKDPLPIFTPRPKEPIKDASLQGHSWMKTTWRVVSEHSVWSAGGEELDRMNLVQYEERTMYEHGTEARDVDFCSVTIDGSLNDDVLQQWLHGISRQQEELQHMEIEFRAQLIARVEIMEMQKNFDAKIKEHATANAKLKEQLQLQRWTKLIRIARISSSISTSYRSQPSVRWESSRTSTATRRRTPGR